MLRFTITPVFAKKFRTGKMADPQKYARVPATNTDIETGGTDILIGPGGDASYGTVVAGGAPGYTLGDTAPDGLNNYNAAVNSESGSDPENSKKSLGCGGIFCFCVCVAVGIVALCGISSGIVQFCSGRDEGTKPKTKSGDLEITVVLLGNEGVGKSSLLARFVTDEFNEVDEEPTLGGELFLSCAFLCFQRIRTIT